MKAIDSVMIRISINESIVSSQAIFRDSVGKRHARQSGSRNRRAESAYRGSDQGV